MYSESQRYDAVIRELLRDAFTLKDLKRFCSDSQRFREAQANVPADAPLNDVIDALMDFARTRGFVPELLSEIEVVRPRIYKRYEDRLPPMGERAASSPKSKELAGSAPVVDDSKSSPSGSSSLFGRVVRLAVIPILVGVVLVVVGLYLEYGEDVFLQRLADFGIVTGSTEKTPDTDEPDAPKEVLTAVPTSTASDWLRPGVELQEQYVNEEGPGTQRRIIQKVDDSKVVVERIRNLSKVETSWLRSNKYVSDDPDEASGPWLPSGLLEALLRSDKPVYKTTNEQKGTVRVELVREDVHPVSFNGTEIVLPVLEVHSSSGDIYIVHNQTENPYVLEFIGGPALDHYRRTVTSIHASPMSTPAPLPATSTYMTADEAIAQFYSLLLDKPVGENDYQTAWKLGKFYTKHIGGDYKEFRTFYKKRVTHAKPSPGLALADGRHWIQVNLGITGLPDDDYPYYLERDQDRGHQYFDFWIIVPEDGFGQ